MEESVRVCGGWELKKHRKNCAAFNSIPPLRAGGRVGSSECETLIETQRSNLPLNGVHLSTRYTRLRGDCFVVAPLLLATT